MKTIAIITNGPVGFLPRFWQDLFAFPQFRKDIQINVSNPEFNDVIKFGTDYITNHQEKFSDVNIIQCNSIKQAVSDADYIIGNYSIGGWDAYHHDMDIPLKYGVSQCVGDTLGPAGIFRFLRSVSVLNEIFQNLPKSSPNTSNSLFSPPTFLNLSNPMAMTVMYGNALRSQSTLGICPGVQNTANLLRMYLGAMPDEMRYVAAGINHMTWFLNVEYNQGGKNGEDWTDGDPIIRENVADDPDMIIEEKLRWDMMEATGYYMAEGSPQLSEYVPYYRKRPELIEQYKGADSGPKSLEHATDWNEFKRQQEKNTSSVSTSNQSSVENNSFCEKPSDFPLAHILNAFETKHSYQFSGNIMNQNSSYITNLPASSCVELPCQIQEGNLVIINSIRLPTICASLCLSNIMVQQLTVEAALERNSEKIIHALLMDPNTASVCSPAEIRSMGKELIEANKKWITWLK